MRFITALAIALCWPLAAQPPVTRVVPCSSSDGSDTYTCNSGASLSAYTTNMLVLLTVTTANTGAATLNVDTLGAKAIYKLTAGATTALADNDIRTTARYLLAYDGTNFQVISQVGNVAAGGGSSYYQTVQSAGTPQTQRGKLNLIAGSNVTITPADDAGNDRTNVTIAATGGGGGGPVPREFVGAVCQSSAGSLAMNAASTASPVPDCVISGTSGGVLFGVAKFADDATYALQGSLLLGSTLTSVAATVVWRTAVANASLAAVWQLQTACVGAGESEDPAWNTVQTVTSSANASAGRLLAATFGAVTTTGCAANEVLQFRISRDPTHASDTLAGTAELKSITFFIQ